MTNNYFKVGSHHFFFFDDTKTSSRIEAFDQAQKMGAEHPKQRISAFRLTSEVMLMTSYVVGESPEISPMVDVVKWSQTGWVTKEKDLARAD